MEPSSISNNKKKIIFWIVLGIIIITIIIAVIWILSNTGEILDPCAEDSFNCENFSSQAEAQEIFELCGGVNNDIHQLDRDKNGIACENLE